MNIHPRIHEKHPELEEADIEHAWDNQLASAMRPDAPNFPCIVAIGSDTKGRLIEMIATLDTEGWFIYHAFTPPTQRVIEELFGKGRKKNG